MNILVVDDDVDFADGMSDMLSLIGHKVRTAYSCDEAVEAANHVELDLALIDVGLAERTGPECANAIREFSESTVFVLTTGYSVDALKRMGISTESFTVLRKPIKPEELEPYLTNEFPTPRQEA